MFSGSREWLHLPLAEQGGSKEFCKGERLEALEGHADEAGTRYHLICHGDEEQVGRALAPVSARNPSK